MFSTTYNAVSAQTTPNLYSLDTLLIFISIPWSINHAEAVYHEHSKAEICVVLVDLKCVFRSDGKLRIRINRMGMQYLCL